MEFKIKVLTAFMMAFVVVFAMGCIGGDDKEDEGVGDGYTLSVNPRMVVAGGIATIDFRVRNIFENDMEEIDIYISGVPTARYTGVDETEKIDVIVPGQEYPIIWTMGTPDTTIKESVTPSIKVCFDYETEFFFDMGIKPRALAAESVSLQKGHSRGPVTVSQSGLENVFTNGSDIRASGSISLNNNWIGTIESFNIVNLTVGQEDSRIKAGNLSYANCKGTPALDGSHEDCTTLRNKLAIGRGMTIRADLTVGDAGDSIQIERVNGMTSYTYCYEVPMGTLTVCPIGQRC